MKLISLNLDCHKSWAEKKESLIKSIKKESPDILCLQELSCKQEGTSTLFTNESIELQKELKYVGYFSAAYKCSPNQGIFIKKENIEVNKKFHFSFSGILPNGTVEKHRRFLLAESFILPSKKEFLVINLHLSTNKDFRINNWRETMLWLTKSQLITNNILLVGDFNTYEESDVQKEILNSGFINSWAKVNTNPCVTYHSTNWWIKKYPRDIHSQSIIDKGKNWPKNCLDYIFYKGNFIIEKVRYFDLVPTVSDHRGLIIDFKVQE